VRLRDDAEAAMIVVVSSMFGTSLWVGDDVGDGVRRVELEPAKAARFDNAEAASRAALDVVSRLEWPSKVGARMVEVLSDDGEEMLHEVHIASDGTIR
jgi:hypothetical protein